MRYNELKVELFMALDNRGYFFNPMLALTRESTSKTPRGLLLVVSLLGGHLDGVFVISF